MASACEKDAKRDTQNIADTGQTVRKDVGTSPANICMSCLKNTVKWIRSQRSLTWINKYLETVKYAEIQTKEE